MENGNRKSTFVDRPATIVEKKYFLDPGKGKNYQHYFFKDVSAKDITFKSIDFSFCLFENIYFRNCKFEDCKFIGAKFQESNFRGSSFLNCAFQYSVFRSTEVAAKELLCNLSPWPNVNRDWLRRLRVNYESIGDVYAVKLCVKAEMQASREHLRKARAADEGYYAKKYKGISSRFSVYVQSIGNFFDWHLWGHGEYPHKLLLMVLLVILFFSALLMFDHNQISGSSTWMSIVHSSINSVRDVIYTFVGVRQPSVPDGMAALLATFRYVALGLFISVLYKSIARR